jgi:hypothetical protein
MALFAQMTAPPKSKSAEVKLDVNDFLKPERATKFTYNADNGRWEMKTTKASFLFSQKNLFTLIWVSPSLKDRSCLIFVGLCTEFQR